MTPGIYLTALQAATEAGDAESQFRLAEHHLGNCSFNLQRNGSVKVLGKSHWDTALSLLNKAISSGHADAQMLLGTYLLKGHPVLGRHIVRGSIHWLNGWITKHSSKLPDIRTRLLARAMGSKAEGPVNSVYSRIPYLGGIGNASLQTCRIRFTREQNGSCHAVIEQSSSTGGPSVTNSAEQIATRAIYQLWIDGIDALPEKIVWYEAYPAHPDAMHPNGSLVGIEFEWDGEVYRHPRWKGRPKHAVPVDLKDILTAEGR